MSKSCYCETFFGLLGYEQKSDSGFYTGATRTQSKSNSYITVYILFVLFFVFIHLAAHTEVSSHCNTRIACQYIKAI